MAKKPAAVATPEVVATKPARKTAAKKTVEKTVATTPWPFPITPITDATPAPTVEAKAEAKAPAKPRTARKASAKKADATPPATNVGKPETPPETKAETKPAQQSSDTKAKATRAAVEFVTRKMQPGQVLTVIAEANGRPTQGTALFAHTHAALTVLGLLDASCPSVPVKNVLALMGQTAVSYHLNSTQHFERRPNDTIRLTTKGYNKFRDRRVDAGLANMFVELFLDGKIDKSLKLRDGQTFPWKSI